MSVCRVTSCLCVDWRHVYRLTKLQTGTSGHKWRPGHRDIGNKNDDRDTQRESDRDTKNVRLAITINKAPGHKWRPGHREYKWRPGHSKRNYRPGHRNTNDDRDTGKQQQWGRRGHRGIGQLCVACSRVGKPDNLFICTDTGTAKNVVYSQVLRS